MLFFFFQAEDGIRDVAVTGVQTCALPISSSSLIVPMRSRARYAGSAQPRAGQRSRELCGATVAEMRPSFTPRCAAARVSSGQDRKSTRLNSSHGYISYAVFCLKKKNNQI